MGKQATEELKTETYPLRREVKRQLRRAYATYLNNLLTGKDQEADQATKNERFWTFMKHQESSNCIIAPLKTEGKLVLDPTVQADILNRQFQSVFSEVRSYTYEEFQAKCNMGSSHDFPVLNSIQISVE